MGTNLKTNNVFIQIKSITLSTCKLKTKVDYKSNNLHEILFNLKVNQQIWMETIL